MKAVLSLQGQINERLGIIGDLKRDLLREKSPVKKQAISETILALEWQVGNLRKEIVAEAPKRPLKNMTLPLGEKEVWRRIEERTVRFGPDGCPLC